MPRRPRFRTGGYVFHVLNRAVRRKTIFATEGKAPDGGDLGCRHTPETIEMCKKVFELRKQGIIKF